MMTEWRVQELYTSEQSIIWKRREKFVSQRTVCCRFALTYQVLQGFQQRPSDPGFSV